MLGPNGFWTQLAAVGWIIIAAVVVWFFFGFVWVVFTWSWWQLLMAVAITIAMIVHGAIKSP